MGQPFLKRVQIAAQLDNIFEHPLTLVVAAMGTAKPRQSGISLIKNRPAMPG